MWPGEARHSVKAGKELGKKTSESAAIEGVKMTTSYGIPKFSHCYYPKIEENFSLNSIGRTQNYC